jgi:hypothetical protein
MRLKKCLTQRTTYTSTDIRTTLTTDRYVTVLPSYCGIHGVTPRRWLLTTRITAEVLCILHFREHIWRTVVWMGKLRVPALTWQPLLSFIYCPLVETTSPFHTVICRNMFKSGFFNWLFLCVLISISVTTETDAWHFVTKTISGLIWFLKTKK